MKNYTVVLTYHNEGDVLTQTLQSLLVQEYLPTEILIFDDSSTIQPEAFIPAALKTAVRILRSEKNIGPARARNEALKEVTTEFVHFHDSDDLFLPQWSLKVSETLELHPETDWVIWEVQSRFPDKVVQGIQGIAELKSGIFPDWTSFLLNRAILTSGALYRTSVLRKLGAFDTEFWQSEDFELHLRLAIHRVKACFMEDSLIERRSQPGRSAKASEVWKDAFRALKKHESAVAETHPNDLCQGAKRIAVELCHCGEWATAYQAFEFAGRYGKLRFSERSPLFQFLARWTHPVFAEFLGQL